MLSDVKPEVWECSRLFIKIKFYLGALPWVYVRSTLFSVIKIGSAAGRGWNTLPLSLSGEIDVRARGGVREGYQLLGQDTCSFITVSQTIWRGSPPPSLSSDPSPRHSFERMPPGLECWLLSETLEDCWQGHYGCSADAQIRQPALIRGIPWLFVSFTFFFLIDNYVLIISLLPVFSLAL